MLYLQRVHFLSHNKHVLVNCVFVMSGLGFVVVRVHHLHDFPIGNQSRWTFTSSVRRAPPPRFFRSFAIAVVHVVVNDQKGVLEAGDHLNHGTYGTENGK